MSDHTPTEPYIFQPYGMQHPQWWEDGRVYGVRTPDWRVEIRGLTKAEADVVCDALKRLHAREALTRMGQELGEY